MMPELPLVDTAQVPANDAERVQAMHRRSLQSFRPPPRLTMSEWADQKFYLSAESAAEPGRWHTLPYQREVLDAFTDPLVEEVVWMKSARVGYTKCLNIVVGYHIEHDPCPIMIVLPTLDDAEGHSKEEIAPMLRDCASLTPLVSDVKSRDSDNTILRKLFPGGSLTLVGANSARGFRRVSRRIVLFDETDGYPRSAGTEGDPLRLGKKRTEFYWNRKLGYGSTPTTAGVSRIEALFEAGDQRYFFVPCPHCGRMDRLVFREDAVDKQGEPIGHFMAWPKDRPDGAHFVCRDCGGEIEEHQKRDMIAAGEWRASAPFNGRASFHIWTAYSYSPNATWTHIAREFIEANKGGPEDLKTFVNTTLGETWKEKGDAPDWERLYYLRESYDMGKCPRGVLFLTAGVDVQKDRLIYEVVGWGRGKASWSIDIGVIPGDPSDDTSNGPWGPLDALLSRIYPHESGASLPIGMMAIDSGYSTQAVYNWVRKHAGSRVMATKGTDRAKTIVNPPTSVDVDYNGVKVANGCKVWPLGVNIIKTELYGWLRLKRPTPEARAMGEKEPPGVCHFPQYGEEFFKQLTAEKLISARKRGGFIVWEWALQPGRENHQLDTRVYARAAAAIAGLDRFTETDWTSLERVTNQMSPSGDAPPPPGNGPRGRFGKSRYLGAE
jgi:phage terminase large subunit GpA-like protein